MISKNIKNIISLGESETLEFIVLALDRLPKLNEITETELILKKLNLYEGRDLKRAAMLLFGKNPQNLYPQTTLRIGKFNNESDLITTEQISGNLFYQAEQTLKILENKYLLKKIRYVGIHRREILEYPYDALREAIINSLIHRSYNTTSSIQIKVYPDKLTILNEGKLPNEVSIDDLRKEHLSKPGNILLAEVFYKAGLIESWGSGTLKIIKLCKLNNLPDPDFEENEGVFKITFYKDNSEIEVGEKVGEKLTMNQNKIIKLIRNDNKITIKEMAITIGIAEKNIESNLKKLKEKKYIERIGAAKGGYWKIL